MDRNKMIAKLNEMCKKYDRKDYPGIAVGVVENGDLIFCKGYGEANLEYNISIDENTVFHACSMTKQFTAACIALLIEERKLSLDQDVSSFFPKLKDYGEKVTIYNLLYMTNGIPDVYSTANFVCGIREDEGITRDEFWRYVTACDWKFFKPGDRWSYGNTGYFLLGQIIEAVTNTSLSQYADEHIFKPLGMNNTFIRDDRTKIIKNRAVGYSNYDHVHFNDSYKRYTSRNDTLSINEENVEIGGAGQIWTTINDLLLWDKNFYNNILGEVSREFYPIYREKVDASRLKIYEGNYCCEKLGVSYNVKIDNGKLYIRNENLHNNALDLYYTLAVNDTFICEYNGYTGNYCITFNRDLNDEIASFSYRDDAQTLRENFIFVKIK